MTVNDQPSTVNESGRYCGRFAPSPTGSLHFGSLVAAVASYAHARQANGAWLVRIEDVDRPREVPGSADEIIATLAELGFEWTGSILRQSARNAAYAAALEGLTRQGLAYRCSCSRRKIATASPRRTGVQVPQVQERKSGRRALDTEDLHYPGWCRNGPLEPAEPCAFRLRVANGPVGFDDEIQGTVTVDVATDCGDFVLQRRDRLFAYQLAVTVDDAEQGVTHVVRGADLLSSTPRQILLQRALGLATPRYAHVPLATDHNGVKLSKSAGAGAVDRSEPVAELWRAMTFLRQSPPAELRSAGLNTLWNWAIEHWTTAPLRGSGRAATVDTSTERAG